MQAAGRTGLDAGRLQPFADAIRAQCAFIDPLGFRIEFRNIEWAACNAIPAANTIGLLKVHDAVGILHDGTIGGASFQAAGLSAMHALMFSHQPLQTVVFALVLVKQNQVPVIPPRIRHGLVSIVKYGRRKRHAVPFYACHLACLTPNTGRGVNQFAYLKVPLGVPSGDGPGMS